VSGALTHGRPWRRCVGIQISRHVLQILGMLHKRGVLLIGGPPMGDAVCTQPLSSLSGVSLV
jgi:hypothetical protein